MKFLYHLLFVIFLICFIVSSIITFTPTPAICNPGDGCDVVLTSSYAETFGIKNSAIGMIGFGILTILTLLQIINKSNKKRNFIFLGIAIGSLIALYFIFLQAFVLQAWCKYCMVVDVGLLISLGLITISKKE
jgi:uncharacterized membrane protein